MKNCKEGANWSLKHQGDIIDKCFHINTNKWNIHRPNQGRVENQHKDIEKELSEVDFQLTKEKTKLEWKFRSDGQHGVKDDIILLTYNYENKKEEVV